MRATSKPELNAEPCVPADFIPMRSIAYRLARSVNSDIGIGTPLVPVSIHRLGMSTSAGVVHTSLESIYKTKDDSPLLLNRRQSLVVSGCDSFNCLEHVSKLVLWAVATVLRFLYKGRQADKHGPFRDSFNSLNSERFLRVKTVASLRLHLGLHSTLTSFSKYHLLGSTLCCRSIGRISCCGENKVYRAVDL